MNCSNSIEYYSSVPKRLKLKDFIFGKTLGEGLQGKINIVRNIHTGKLSVSKKMKKMQLIQLKHVDHIHSELHVLSYLSEKKDTFFFVNLEGFMQDDQYFYLVMEYGKNSDLYNYMYNFKGDDSLHITELKFFASNIVCMFEILHDKNIIYRDLKPENILIDDDGYLKLTDFGFAKYCTNRTYTLCGTSEYLAPEILLNKGYGKSVDWWTFGIILYEMFFGITPFYDPDPLRLYNKILNQKYSFPEVIDHNSKSLIKNLLVVDLSKRYGNLKNGVNDVKHHKFFLDVDWEKMAYKQYSSCIDKNFLNKNVEENKLFDSKNDSENYICATVSISEDPFINW